MSGWTTQDPLNTYRKGHNAVDRNSANFGNFAVEIYIKVIEHLHAARDVASLSETCRRFRDLISRDGWRVFVQINFPSLIRNLPPGVENTSAEWRHLACSLTAQSRAWDQRAISAATLTVHSNQMLRLVNAFWTDQQFGYFVSRRGMVYDLLKWENDSNQFSPFQISSKTHFTPLANHHRPPSSRQQSTPFHPAIDTRLEFSGNLLSKCQIVAWSTGPEVFIQIRRSGSFVPRPEDDPHDHSPYHDEYLNRLNFFTAQHGEFRSGVDDVTSINIMEPCTHLRESLHSSLAVDFIAGRASGHLHRFSVSNAEPVRVVVNTFHSIEQQGLPLRRCVRSADINSKTGTSLLTACSDKVISLYKTEIEAHDVWPVSEFEIEFDLEKSQAWTVKFSSNENLLLGLGQSVRSLHAYKASPTGLVLTEKLGDKCDIADVSELTSRSVYAIEPLSGASRAGGSSNGDIFLSGSYDGFCRLYDRRAGGSPVQSFYDPISTESAIYSLASFGEERFLAGSANSNLMIFDFRNSAKVYHYTDGLPCSESRPTPNGFYGARGGPKAETAANCHHDFRTGPMKICQFHHLSRTNVFRRNTTIFLYGAPRVSNPYTRAMSRHEKSPIFSLSSPDPICPVVYAGTTGMVYELEVSDTDHDGKGMLDPYFAAPRGAAPGKQNQVELTMFEMDDGESGQSLPDNVYVHPKGLRLCNGNFDPNTSRLDTRWQYGGDG